MLPFTSLNSVAANGTGASKDLESVFATHTLIATVTGGATAGRVKLEGSHDGSNWAVLAQTATFDGSTEYLLDYTGSLVRYVRAELVSLGGGTSPTVTATIASG